MPIFTLTSNGGHSVTMGSNWPLNLLLYFFLGGAIELAALVIAGAAALPFVNRRGWGWYWRLVRRWILFALLLLIFGAVGNVVFMRIAYDRMYISADTVVDFFPFIPFGQWVLDNQFGLQRGRLLNGSSLSQVQMVWLLIAAPVWAATIAVSGGYVRVFGPKTTPSAQ